MRGKYGFPAKTPFRFPNCAVYETDFLSFHAYTLTTNDFIIQAGRVYAKENLNASSTGSSKPRKRRQASLKNTRQRWTMVTKHPHPDYTTPHCGPCQRAALCFSAWIGGRLTLSFEIEVVGESKNPAFPICCTVSRQHCSFCHPAGAENAFPCERNGPRKMALIKFSTF